MFNTNDLKRIMFVYSNAKNDRKKVSAVISLAIEFDIKPEFIRLAILRETLK